MASGASLPSADYTIAGRETIPHGQQMENDHVPRDSCVAFDHLDIQRDDCSASFGAAGWNARLIRSNRRNAWWNAGLAGQVLDPDSG